MSSAMDTPASLLEQLRRPDAGDAWKRFVELYTPLLSSWAGRLGLQEADADDLLQDVFVQLHRTLPTFRYEATRSFRGWLRTLLLNKHREVQRRRRPHSADPQGEVLANLEGADGLAALEKEEYQQYLVGQALALMRRKFPPVAWQACWESVVGGRPAAEVAAELGVTPAVVYVARFRVLRHLRQELEGLLD